MTAPLRLTLALVALLVPPVALGLRSAPRPWSGPPLERVLPTQLGSYSVVERIQLDPEIAAVVQPSDYVFWQYADAARLPVVAYLAAYANVRELGAGAHDPRLCYPAQGWEILTTEELSVPLENGDALRATLMLSQQGERRELVLFWVQPTGRWPGSPAREQLLGLRDALLGTDRFVFVRLSTPGDGEGDTRALVDFAAGLAPRVRGFLD